MAIAHHGYIGDVEFNYRIKILDTMQYNTCIAYFEVIQVSNINIIDIGA